MTGQIILINKPYRWTSFDVVRKVRNALQQQIKKEPGYVNKKKIEIKVGHAGTLDPLATGLLVICTGSLTKKISEIQDAEKEYTGTFFLGATTPSYDLETEITEIVSTSHITEEQLRVTSEKFLGKQIQTPPVHSAVKVDGKRAYARARKGEEVIIKPREIQIREFEITSVNLPLVSFRVVCSKGTYIRSLADDFGKALGVGAYLNSLCRVRIGDFSVNESLDPQEFINQLPDKQVFQV
jgi:tRNA pseudouridine55 synthase